MAGDEAWRLDEGPEWNQSRLRVEPNFERFEESFRSVRWVLERDPYAFSEALIDQEPSRRVFTTRDFKAGFELLVCFEVFESNRSCELSWMDLRRLGPDEDLWAV